MTEGISRKDSVVNEIDQHQTSVSPFDTIRQVRQDGSEFWSARDLMPLLGYEKWERFADAVERAIVSMRAQGHDADVEASRLREPFGRTRQMGENFHLSRFACYLVAMNGDVRKAEVAAAQAYFAIKTREAEVAPTRELTFEEMTLKVITESQNRIKELSAKVEADAPKVDLAERYLTSPGNARLVREVAKALGMTERNLRAFLIEEKLLYRRQSLCGSWSYDFYAEFADHFDSRETVVTHGFGNCSHYTVYVTPRGVDLIRKRMSRAVTLP